MKVYISADMEGLTGVTHWNEVTKKESDYSLYQERMTMEVCAACEGALDEGATEIVVKDAHASGRNISGSGLPEKVKLISGWSGHPYSMVQELDSTFDAVMMVGYHSLAGSAGNPLSHTMSSSKIAEIKINGIQTSEFYLHGLMAAELNVPVTLVTGDEDLGKHVHEINPNITMVAVKKGIGDSTINRHPDEVLKDIRESAAKSLTGSLNDCLLKTADSYMIEISFVKHHQAYFASFYPGVELAGPNSIVFQTDSFFEVMKLISFVV